MTTPTAARDEASLLRDPAFVVALVIAVVVALGFGLVVPVLPEYARSFGVGLFAASAVVAVFAGVRLVSNLFTGALADRIGTRRAVGWGAIVVAVSSLAVAAAPSYAALLVVRGLGGFGSALFFNALITLVITSVSGAQRGRAVGMLQGAFLFGMAFGPTVGGLLAEPLGLRWPFAIYAVFCAAAGLVAFGFLPRPAATGRPSHADGARGPDDEPVLVAPAAGGTGRSTPTWAVVRDLCRDHAFVAALIMMAVSRWAATGIRFSLIPLFGREVVGASHGVVGLALTLAAVTHLMVAWPAGKVADTYGRRTLAWPAYLAFAAISLAVVWATTVPAFVVVLALYGIGTGFTAVTPPAVVGDVVPPDRSGVGVGTLNTAGDVGSVLGPLVCGWLAGAAGYGWAFGASAALLVVGAVVAFRMRETLPRGEPAPALAG